MKRIVSVITTLCLAISGLVATVAPAQAVERGQVPTLKMFGIRAQST